MIIGSKTVYDNHGYVNINLKYADENISKTSHQYAIEYIVSDIDEDVNHSISRPVKKEEAMRLFTAMDEKYISFAEAFAKRQEVQH